MRISIIGPPGRGKGTQAELLSRAFLIPRICVGTQKFLPNYANIRRDGNQN